MNHCLERSDKSDKSGRVYEPKEMLCAATTQRIVLGAQLKGASGRSNFSNSCNSCCFQMFPGGSYDLKCLVSKDTNSWSTEGVSLASSSQIAQVTGESGSTGSSRKVPVISRALESSLDAGQRCQSNEGNRMKKMSNQTRVVRYSNGM